MLRWRSFHRILSIRKGNGSVVDLTLTAATPLDGLSLQFEEIELAEVNGRALVSLAVPNGGEAALADRIKQAYGVDLPTVGNSTSSQTDNASLLGMARDQIFLLFDDPSGDPVAHVEKLIGESAYLVDQSDSWVILAISGSQARTALERICPIDLSPRKFTIGHVARTVMEHHAGIVMRTDADRYLLLSPRSSAKSFAHAVQVSAENVT
jgi:sarcosine oxidase subunit gamma